MDENQKTTTANECLSLTIFINSSTARGFEPLPPQKPSMPKSSSSASGGLHPDDFVFSALVKACANLGSIKLGKQVHCRFIVTEYSHDDVVKSSLVDMYAKCDSPDVAKVVFDSIRSKNTISWTAMVSGFAKSGRKEEALELFRALPIKNLYSWTALISGFVQSGKGLEAFS
ncbi:unnamed protein product, partial [Thlaspi arvense]